MPSEPVLYFSGAGEGLLDHAVIERLSGFVGVEIHAIYGGSGKPALLERLRGYNAAARYSPWVVLVDLDADWECAPLAKENWLAVPEEFMCFRIAVQAVESWLLADRERMASALSVSVSRIPQNPEVIDDPKRAIVDIARNSRRRDVREDMWPREGSGRKVGPAYTSRLMDFVRDNENGWRPDVAAISNESLSRCLNCLLRVIAHSEGKAN